jgi:hypothetical protein
MDVFLCCFGFGRIVYFLALFGAAPYQTERHRKISLFGSGGLFWFWFW